MKNGIRFLGTWPGVIYLGLGLLAAGGLLKFYGTGALYWLIPGFAAGVFFGWWMND